MEEGEGVKSPRREEDWKWNADNAEREEANGLMFFKHRLR